MQKRKEDPKLYRCLTLQIHGKNGWEDSVTLTLEQPEKGPSGQVSLTYIDDYFTPENRIDHLGACGLPAAWIQMPLEYGLTSRHTSWPVFFSDLIPTGAAQNYWRKFLNLEYQPEGLMLATLLQRGTISPIGNLRIKEAFEQALFDGLDQAGEKNQRFHWEQAAQRMDGFVMHAAERGLMISGGSGAGGDAPKILLRMAQDTEQVWVDPKPDVDSPDDFFLVKFPRRGSQNSRPTSRDIDILKAESAYYCELSAMGVETIDVKKMRFLDDGFHEPTLWLPRFDRHFDPAVGRWSLLGMESINAAINDRHTTRHEAILQKIKELIERYPDHFLLSIEELTAEWVVRDFLNIAFGNSDNHGRNTSFLKTEAGIRLAPVYDFAPMAADPESIHRTLRWDRAIETGGEIQWHRLPKHLSDLGLGNEATIHDQLARMMRQCQGLDERLQARGVPKSILCHPRISMPHLNKRLDRWILDLCGR